MKWWLPSPQPELCQGDVVQDIHQGILVDPTTHLRHATMPKGLNGWAETDKGVQRNNRFHYLAAGSHGYSVILSHGCEIDKGQSRVLMAPIKAIDTVDAPTQAAIRAMKIWALPLLPEIPGGVGTCFADLRSITAVDRKAVERCPRVAGMTPEAERLFQARLIGFFTRLLPQAPAGAAA